MGMIVGPIKSSANAGELSPDLKNKVGLKQFYSGAQRMKNIEPVPQSGFRLLPGTRQVTTLLIAPVRSFVLRVARGLSYFLLFTPGKVDIFHDDPVSGLTSYAVLLPEITADILAGVTFFGERNTVGIFHQDIKTIRLFRETDPVISWTKSDWPYVQIPKVDLGDPGYVKKADQWDIYIRFTNATHRLALKLSVDGNDAPAVELTDAAGNPIAPAGASDARWQALENAMESKLSTLPGLNNDVTVTFKAGESLDLFRVFTVTFGGSLSGYEYQLDAMIVSSADAAALTAHIAFGTIVGEALVSNSQGWFSGMEIYQDRACYFAPKARPSAIAMSQTGEYFTLDIKSQADSGARLEALRTETSEQILHLVESAYLVLFTDQSEWFAVNRVVSRNEPTNFRQVSRNGSRPLVRPVEMESRIWYVSQDGGMLFSMAYDDVSTTYNARPESLLASHLIEDIRRQALQRKTGENNASRLWLVRGDGRLICAIVIEAQEITAFSEWQAADGGLVRDVAVDGSERVWLAIERDGAISIEIMEEQETTCLQATRTAGIDADGHPTGLGALDGKTVWVQDGAAYHGPFTVTGGAIVDETFDNPVRVGLWVPPLYESMPFYKVVQEEQIVMRPGRVHSLLVNVIDSQSLAIGANGRPVRDIPLLSHDANLADPLPYSGPIKLRGLMGMTLGPSVTISQIRPGMLRLMDYTAGVKN